MSDERKRGHSLSSEFALKFEEEGFRDFFSSSDDGERDSCEVGDVCEKEQRKGVRSRISGSERRAR